MGKKFHTIRARVSPGYDIEAVAKAAGVSVNRFLLQALRKGLSGMSDKPLVVYGESIRGREDDKYHDTVEQIDADESPCRRWRRFHI